MSVAKRLARIETSLTPKQAVLLWLKEAQQFDSDEYAEKIFTAPTHEAPRNRVPRMAEEAVRGSLAKTAMEPKLIAKAELEAWKQADSLVVLVLNLNEQVQLDSRQSFPQLAFLWVQLRWMAEQHDEHGVFNATEWGDWRELLINTLVRTRLLRATIAAISERYYDSHSVLLHDHESSLDLCNQGAEQLVSAYNNLEGLLPCWTAIDLAALQSSIEAQVPVAVGEQMVDAEAKTLQAIGEWKAACDLREPYALARIERRRSSRSVCKAPE